MACKRPDSKAAEAAPPKKALKEFSAPATIMVTVANALTGHILLEERAFDVSGFVLPLRAELGHRPSRPVSLFFGDGGEPLGDDFDASPGAVLKLTAAIGQEPSEEEREGLVRCLQACGVLRVKEEFAGMSEAARDDAEIVKAAVRKDSFCLENASEALRNDKEFILEAVRKAPDCLLYANEAVRQEAFCLMYTSDALRNDKEFMLDAVRENPQCLLYASDALRNDQEFLLEAGIWRL